MLMKYLLIAFLICPLLAPAQSLQSGLSAPLWGKMKHATKIDAEYKDIRISYIHAFRSGTDKLGDMTKQNFVGLFFTPDVDLQEVIAEPIIGVMNKKYPNNNGRFIHFGINIRRQLDNNISVFYEHISNGYFGKTNIGLDTIGIRINIR